MALVHFRGLRNKVPDFVSTFSPILRTHTTNNAESEPRICAYPEPYSNIVRVDFQLRYAMQPYACTEGGRAYEAGAA